MIDSPHLQKIRELIVVWSLKTCWIFVAYLVATRSMFKHHLALKGLLPSCLNRVLHSSKACEGSVVLVAKSCTQKVQKIGLTMERPLTCRVVINASKQHPSILPLMSLRIFNHILPFVFRPKSLMHEKYMKNL